MGGGLNWLCRRLSVLACRLRVKQVQQSIRGSSPIIRLPHSGALGGSFRQGLQWTHLSSFALKWCVWNWGRSGGLRLHARRKRLRTGDGSWNPDRSSTPGAPPHLAGKPVIYVYFRSTLALKGYHNIIPSFSCRRFPITRTIEQASTRIIHQQHDFFRGAAPFCGVNRGYSIPQRTERR